VNVRCALLSVLSRACSEALSPSSSPRQGFGIVEIEGRREDELGSGAHRTGGGKGLRGGISWAGRDNGECCWSAVAA
jgi:hypothetical protein